MYYNSQKHKQIMQLPDSDKKLRQLERLALSLGIFNKEPILEECHRLRSLGYKSPAQRYLESKQGNK